MKIADIVAALEKIAPPDLAEEWDNVGLLVGDAAGQTRRLMLCIDLTDGVLDEARRARAKMVMAYHSVIFRAIKSFTTRSAPVAWRAAKEGVSVYSMHTALDAVPGGLNDVLAGVIGIKDARPIVPSRTAGRRKIVCFVPPEDLAAVAQAAFAAGAGRIGEYFDCAYFGHGVGSFCGGAGTHPAKGRPLQHEAAEELRFEVVADKARSADVVAAMRAAHSYETPAIDVYGLEDLTAGCGIGRVGRLDRPTSVEALVARIKRATGLRKIWIIPGNGGRRDRKGTGRRDAAKFPPVETAAVVAGSARDYIADTCQAGASFLLTGELRHHDALEAQRRGLTVACVGHSNSERIGLPHLARRILSELPGLEVVISRSDRDPIEIV